MPSRCRRVVVVVGLSHTRIVNPERSYHCRHCSKDGMMRRAAIGGRRAVSGRRSALGLASSPSRIPSLGSSREVLEGVVTHTLTPSPRFFVLSGLAVAPTRTPSLARGRRGRAAAGCGGRRRRTRVRRARAARVDRRHRRDEVFPRRHDLRVGGHGRDPLVLREVRSSVRCRDVAHPDRLALPLTTKASLVPARSRRSSGGRAALSSSSSSR